jgi:hypothetical protein
MAKKRRGHTREFKIEAVKLVTEQGRRAHLRFTRRAESNREWPAVQGQGGRANESRPREGCHGNATAARTAPGQRPQQGAVLRRVSRWIAPVLFTRFGLLQPATPLTLCPLFLGNFTIPRLTASPTRPLKAWFKAACLWVTG